MRDILFKAKHIVLNKWYEGYYVKIGILHYICVAEEDSSFRFIEIEPSTLCQYTGLKDRNGDKIWEHDIVEIGSEDDYFKLEWQEDTASFVMVSDSFIVTFDNYWSHEIEVIGNIFDNSDLLRGVSNEID